MLFDEMNNEYGTHAKYHGKTFDSSHAGRFQVTLVSEIGSYILVM